MAAKSILWRTGLVRDRGAWIVPDQVLIRSNPRRPRDLAALAASGITTVINLTTRVHHPWRLASHGLREVHLPVPDFTAPTPGQIDLGIAAIDSALHNGQCVLIHCGGGLGRSGTLAACYLVHLGHESHNAIAEVRHRRPGAIETPDQVQAIVDYAKHLLRSDIKSTPTEPHRSME